MWGMDFLLVFCRFQDVSGVEVPKPWSVWAFCTICRRLLEAKASLKPATWQVLGDEKESQPVWNGLPASEQLQATINDMPHNLHI